MRLAGHHHYWRSNLLRFEISQERKAVFARHDHIGENQIEMLRAGQVESFGRVIANRRFMTSKAKRASERSQSVRLIVDDQ